MRIKISLTYYMFMLVVLITVMVAGTLYYYSNQSLINLANVEKMHQAKAACGLVEHYFSMESEILNRMANVLEHDSKLAEIFIRSNSSEIEFEKSFADIEELAQRLKIDTIQLINQKGEIFCTVIDCKIHEHKFKSESHPPAIYGITEAFNGRRIQSVSKYKGHWSLWNIVPVMDNDKVVGVVLLSSSIDSDFLREIDRSITITGFDISISLCTYNDVFATSLYEDEVISHDPDIMMSCLKEGNVIFFKEFPDIHKINYYKSIIINDETFAIAVSIDTAETQVLLAECQVNMIKSTLIVLSIATVIGIGFIKWMIHPLKKLKRRAEALVEETTGHESGEHIGNEIRSLVHSFEFMSDQIVDYIGKQKQMEKELLDHRDILEEEVKERTKELEEKNITLKRAKEAADAANKAKSEFLANMSHEIRTPMNSVLGFGQILEEEDLTEDQKSYVKNICTSGHHLLELINDILDFSKIEADKLKIESIPFKIGDLLDDIESLLLPSALEKDLKFEILQCSELPETIKTDPSRLKQCLINLVNNAIKFTEKGHIYVNVSLQYGNAEEPWVRFDVEDTGIGIPKDKQEAIFESFTQADTSSLREYGGTGLGLTITKKLVGLLGGRIYLTSQPGKGSVFTIIMPAGIDIKSQPEFDKYKYASELVQKPYPDQPDFRGNILVAEDNRSGQELIREILQRLGLTVTMVENGQKAVDEAMTQKYDIIFMDIQMPVMNGHQATRQIRQKGITTPIVAFTANAMKGDEEECLNNGCDAYLSKPINMRKLVLIIQKYLSPQHQQDS